MQNKRKKATAPIFGELAQIEDNPWWNNFLTQLAQGFFPHGLCYRNKMLYYYKKRTKAMFVMDQDYTLSELLQYFKKFIVNNVHLFADDQIPVAPVFYLQVNLAMLNRHQDIQEIVIWNYVKSLKLTREASKNLSDEIFWGFLEGCWTNETFEFENARIVKFHPEKRLSPKKMEQKIARSKYQRKRKQQKRRF